MLCQYIKQITLGYKALGYLQCSLSLILAFLYPSLYSLSRVLPCRNYIAEDILKEKYLNFLSKFWLISL